MGQSQEDFKILMNVLSRTGIDGEVIAEFSKAKALTHNFDSYSQMQAQANMMQNQGDLATQGSPMTPNTPQGEIMAPEAQNQGMGQGDVNLPPNM